MEILTLRVTAEDYLRYTRAARALRISRSELCRRAVESYMTAATKDSDQAASSIDQSLEG